MLSASVMVVTVLSIADLIAYSVHCRPLRAGSYPILRSNDLVATLVLQEIHPRTNLPLSLAYVSLVFDKARRLVR